MPRRVQLSRRKDWRMPENTVKVDRTTRWGNPFTRKIAEDCGACGCNLCCVVRFEQELSEQGIAQIKEHLRGKNLACWCAPTAYCHADILLQIANGWPEPLMPSELTPELAA
jgi:hypothetical protein